ncbi:MAG: hypothetical protein LBR64_10805 [Dysgonamonadaceae bacterium]|jgi:hypothetical protein|nr:hypothetical protein [Dysgonamonadaceae bacterium]
MTELKLDNCNYRLHNDKNRRLIRKSLEDCGAGRSIVIDSEDVIIAGNGVYEQVESGMSDAWIMRNIGMDADELLRLKQITGLAALFKDSEFSNSFETD